MRVAHIVAGVALAVAAAASLACGGAPPPGKTSAKSDPGSCATCHMPEYVATKKPMHVGAKPTTCGVCHESTSWHPSRLDHPFWALAGAHAKAECFECHHGSPPVFLGTGKACVDCHRADYDRSSFPGHGTFVLTCADCHGTDSWKPAKRPPATPAPAAPPAPTAALTPRSAKTPPKPTVVLRPVKPPDVVTQPSRRGPY